MSDREDVLKIAKEKGYATKGNYVSDLNFYKKEVNLIQFAEFLGYKVNTEKTGRNLSYNYHFVRMDYPDTKEPEDRILVFKNKEGVYCFKSVDGSDLISNGSAIDLAQRRKNCSFGESIQALDKFITKNGLGASNISLSPFTVEMGDLDREIKSFNNILPLAKESENYLTNDRCLATETINDEKFKGQILSSEHEIKIPNSEDTKKIINVAFPLRGVRSLEYYVELGDNSFAQAFDVRNRKFKSTEHQSLGSLWRSNFDPKKKIDAIYFGESPIDCMAHFELNKKNLEGKNILYMASTGSVQNSQLVMLQVPFSPLKQDGTPSPIQADKLVSIFDHDLSGAKHTAMMISSLNHNSFSNSHTGLLADESVKILPSVKNKNNTASIIFLKEGNLQDKIVFAQNFSKALDKVNANLTYDSHPDHQRFKCSVKDMPENKLFLEVTFHNSSYNFQLMNDFMIKEKFGKNMKFYQECSVLKDWNDDLKAIKKRGPEFDDYLKKNEAHLKYLSYSEKLLSGKLDLDNSQGLKPKL